MFLGSHHIRCMQGPAVIAEKLGYFIQTGQAVQLMQQTGFQIGNIQLTKFSPLPGTPKAGAPTAGPVGGVATAGPTPAPSGTAAAAPAPGAAATLGNPQLAQAGTQPPQSTLYVLARDLVSPHDL
jgi:hypothetical protein